jgi:hypothetical protein
MFNNLIKNPIVVGIFVGSVIYMCLQWMKNQQDLDEDPDQDQDPKEDSVNTKICNKFIKFNSQDEIFIPVTMGIVAAIFTYSYYDKSANRLSYDQLPNLSDSSTQVFKVGTGINISKNRELPECFLSTVF